jgi:hypothetical protein
MLNTMEPDMIFIGLDQSTLDDVVSRIAAHLPVGASMGRILAATNGVVLTDSGTWGLGRAATHCWRMVQIDNELWERVAWRSGEELIREIVRDELHDPSPASGDAA